jgi:hypothetical protein
MRRLPTQGQLSLDRGAGNSFYQEWEDEKKTARIAAPFITA